MAPEELSPQTPKLEAVSDQPVPVVRVLSVRGVEYLMMHIALWLVAGSLVFGLLAIIGGESSFDVMAFPASLLLVAGPIFGFLYLRLRAGELANPALRFEASKRRMSQITQTLAFITVLSNLVGFVYRLLQEVSGHGTGSLWKTALSLLVVVGVAGGLLAYFWVDEHKLVK